MESVGTDAAKSACRGGERCSLADVAIGVAVSGRWADCCGSFAIGRGETMVGAMGVLGSGEE